ncbi:Protein NLP9 [Rhizoctonia solani]|uniref:Protein NLP9 n=1 Tax=Rhizoctonia solani TaxID=456999 RepID=A0A0K6G882_9AGAM|nr:Protein NLP9 [Rhizoctonia solani]
MRLGELADLENAVEYFSRALALTADGHTDVVYRHAELGVSYTNRYERLDNLADLEKALECYSRALELTPDGHPDMSRRHSDLGVSYANRYEHLGEFADLERALECYCRALALTPDGHPELPRRHFNHALSLFLQYEHTSLDSHLQSSITSFVRATQIFTGTPRNRFRYALEWANLASDYPVLNPLEAYRTAIDLLPQFIWLGATTSQPYYDLSKTESLAVNACRSAIQSSDYSLALELLEHARCVVWSQSLALRSPLDQLRASHPDLATRLQAVANELHTSGFGPEVPHPTLRHSTTSEKAGQQRRRLASEYNSMLAQTRQLPGFDSFLLPMKAKELMRAARSGPVVVINCPENQCDALIILTWCDHVRYLPLPGCTDVIAQQAHSEVITSLRREGLRQRGVKHYQPLDHVAKSIENVLQVLWSTVVKPVLAELGYLDKPPKDPLPHVTWYPTGPLSFLPLHAAGDYSQPGSRIFDYVVSSYTPTLSALLEPIHSSLSLSTRVLAIGQATTPGHKPLPGTTDELAHIKTHAHNKVQYTQLIDNQAAPTFVLDAMEHHDWVHLACHAHQNVYDPTKSGFYLHNGTLDLASINRRSFRNKGLAFLSACQTATGDERLPDEAVHLASGMLMAGYPSVIATMWSVVDEDAPFVADKVYEQLMKDGKIGNGEAGRALHYAIEGYATRTKRPDHHLMTPPPTTPKEHRLRHNPANKPTTKHTLKTSLRKDWSSSLNNLRGTLITLYNDFAVIPVGNAELKSPELVLNGYNGLRLTLTDIITSLDCLSRDIRAEHPHLNYLSPKFSMSIQTDDPPPPPLVNEESPILPPPSPPPLPKTYASVATSHNSSQQRQAPPRHPPSTPRTKPPTVKPLNPVRIVLQLAGTSTPPIRDIPAPELFRRLTEACAKVPSSPAPLGAQWNRKNNLIISFPAGATRTAIKPIFPHICSLLGFKDKPVIRFDVPWRRVHLAGIRARNSPDQPIASLEDLCQTLQLNPTFQTLNITVQPTWLKKPEAIVGTHTSAVVAFEDPDGSIERMLLKSTLFAFGKMVTLKKWHDRTVAK